MILIYTFLMLVFMPIISQGQTSADIIVNNEKPKSVLRLGLTSYSRYDYDLGLELNYERFITPRLGVRASVFSNLRLNKNEGIALSYNIGNLSSFTDYNPVANFSVAFNYYLKKNSRNGHFLSLQVNDVFAFSDRSSYLLSTGSTLVDTRDKRVFQSNPEVGIYYGYRKNFKSGLFIEGRVGVFYEDSINNLFRRTNSLNLDGQLTVGWELPFRKRKKR